MKSTLFPLILFGGFFAVTTLMFGQNTNLEYAKKHFDRGSAAAENAESLEDFNEAINEFESARLYAPEWADIHYNLGILYDKIEKYQEAIIYLRYYLSLEPNADDADEVQTMINKIEYKMEKAADKQNMYERLIGTWDRYDPETGEKLNSYTFSYDGSNLTVGLFSPYGGITAPVSFDGQKLEFKYFYPMSVYDSEDHHIYTITSPGIMKGSIQVNIVSVQPNNPIFKVGKKPRMPMEMRKR